MAFSAARLAGIALIGAVALSPLQAAAQQQKSKVVLLSSGKGKKSKLRFRPKAGTTQHIKVTSGQSMAMKLGQMSLPQQQLPDTEITMQLKVVKVEPNGNIQSTFTTTDVNVVPNPSVPQQVVTEMKKNLELLKSFKGMMTIDECGNVLSADMKSKGPTSPQAATILSSLRQNIGQLVLPMPTQAVGIGARWRVDQSLAKMGFAITQQTTMTLVKRTGTKVVIESDLVQKVAAGPAKLPNLQPGASVKTKPTQSTGSGRMEVDLSALGAQGTSNIDLNISLVMSDGAENQTMDIAMKVKLDAKKVQSPKP